MQTVCCKARLPNIANMLSIKNLNTLMISVSENFLAESELFYFLFFLQNKICPLLRQGVYIYVGHSFLCNTVELINFFCLLAFSENSCVECRTDLNYLAFYSFDCERRWRELFEKRVLSTKIYLCFCYYHCV